MTRIPATLLLVALAAGGGAAVVTEFGCFNYVDGGKMVGRVCSD